MFVETNPEVLTRVSSTDANYNKPKQIFKMLQYCEIL